MFFEINSLSLHYKNNMNKKKKENQKKTHVFMYELGKFMVDIAKLVFGGVILAGIMDENIDHQMLFTIGSIVVLAFAMFGLYVISRNKEE